MLCSTPLAGVEQMFVTRTFATNPGPTPASGVGAKLKTKASSGYEHALHPGKRGGGESEKGV